MNLLFSDIVRTRIDPKSFSESYYCYLNKSALPEQDRIRILLEQWFSDYATMSQTGPEHQDRVRTKLCRDFCSKANRQHWGGFFELYCHELLRSQNFIVEVEPKRGMSKSKRIDFLAYTGETPLFYMEATISIGDESMDGSHAWLNQLCDSLNDLVSPNFHLHMQATSIPLPSSKMPSTKAMRKHIQTQLTERDPDELFTQMISQGLHSIPLQKFDRDGWTIMISLKPVSPERRHSTSQRILSSTSYPARWTYDTEIMPLLTSLEDKKPSEYGNFDLSYIIAVNMINTISQDNIYNVLIKHRYFEKHPKVSSVLIASELVPRAIPRKTPILWHNPWADNPLDQDIWLGPQVVQNSRTLQWQYREGKKGSELFLLYEEWPE